MPSTWLTLLSTSFTSFCTSMAVLRQPCSSPDSRLFRETNSPFSWANLLSRTPGVRLGGVRAATSLAMNLIESFRPFRVRFTELMLTFSRVISPWTLSSDSACAMWKSMFCRVLLRRSSWLECVSRRSVIFFSIPSHASSTSVTLTPLLAAVQTTGQPTIKSTLCRIKAYLYVQQTGLDQCLHMNALRLLHLLLAVHVLPMALVLHRPNPLVTVVLQAGQTALKSIKDLSSYASQLGVQDLFHIKRGARDRPSSSSA
ncbi:hypothetical protein F7725_000834 [Dissostichus mawsoni]|uniref:Secreted protein n=1 Tax=Dissostichus mawsoni TaxID=36200 RepID=A0A7J5ZHU6_DISMA|nr:hypothetical protein F7725_000834 [Dissostichus mawsoni]